MALFTIEKKRMSPSNMDYYAAIPVSTGAGDITTTSPINGNNVVARRLPTPTKGSGIIDVYKTFDWTTSPINNANFANISKTPFAKLTEYRMNDTAIINSMLYYVRGFGDQIGTLASAVSPDFVEDVKNLIGKVKNAVVGESGADVTQQKQSSSSPWLKPYDGLYSLEDTGFTYFLPYFENDAFRADSSYESMSYPGIDTLKAAREKTAEFTKIIAPGQYIETPKIFSLTDNNSQTIDIKFPLLNTLSFEGAVKNYQLLWLLIFQNTPQRVTKSVVELPRMYDVHIPGVTFMKFAYIDSMKVDFIGVRRRVTIPMPQCPNNPAEAEVVMPDAYQVTISLKSTIMNANNMMLENWRVSTPQT